VTEADEAVSDQGSSIEDIDLNSDEEEKLWNMPTIKKSTEYRRDKDEEEERLRLDWGDDDDNDSRVYKKGKQLTKKEA
jgi:hypothetical protein